MSAKGARRAAVAGGGIAVVLAGVAFAAAPLPHAGKVYNNGTVGKSKLQMTLVISPGNPRKIEAGAPEFSDTAHSGGYLECPSSRAIAEFPFPGATLKLSGGRYGFSVTESKSDPTFLGSATTGTLKLRIKGTVASAARITGTVAVSGDVCKAGTVRYSLPLNSELQG